MSQLGWKDTELLFDSANTKLTTVIIAFVTSITNNGASSLHSIPISD